MFSSALILPSFGSAVPAAVFGSGVRSSLPVSVFRVLSGSVLCPLHFQVSDGRSCP